MSEAFVTWDEGKTYVSGVIVKNGSAYYRATETHTSAGEFDQQIKPPSSLSQEDAMHLRNTFATTSKF